MTMMISANMHGLQAYQQILTYFKNDANADKNI